MPLEDDERFLSGHGWTWYLDALRFHRDRLNEEEERDPARDGIERAKINYYCVAVSKLAEMERKRNPG
jgi:hypothetical protein